MLLNETRAMPVLEKKSSQLHVSEPSSINVASDADSVPEVNEICDPRYPLGGMLLIRSRSMVLMEEM